MILTVLSGGLTQVAVQPFRPRAARSEARRPAWKRSAVRRAPLRLGGLGFAQQRSSTAQSSLTPDATSYLGPELNSRRCGPPSAVLKSLQPGSLPDCKAALGGSGNISASVFWSRRHSEGQDTGTRAVLLYGAGARVCGSVTPSSFGGKSAAFGFLQWWAKDSPVRKGGR